MIERVIEWLVFFVVNWISRVVWVCWWVWMACRFARVLSHAFVVGLFLPQQQRSVLRGLCAVVIVVAGQVAYYQQETE